VTNFVEGEGGRRLLAALRGNMDINDARPARSGGKRERVALVAGRAKHENRTSSSTQCGNRLTDNVPA